MCVCVHVFVCVCVCVCVCVKLVFMMNMHKCNYDILLRNLLLTYHGSHHIIYIDENK